MLVAKVSRTCSSLLCVFGDTKLMSRTAPALTMMISATGSFIALGSVNGCMRSSRPAPAFWIDTEELCSGAELGERACNPKLRLAPAPDTVISGCVSELR